MDLAAISGRIYAHLQLVFPVYYSDIDSLPLNLLPMREVMISI
jgi:hypothetical protein